MDWQRHLIDRFLSKMACNRRDFYVSFIEGVSGLRGKAVKFSEHLQDKRVHTSLFYHKFQEKYEGKFIMSTYNVTIGANSFPKRSITLRISINC